MTFGEKLQKLRVREGLSQDRLAELLDVSRQAVSKWERNETMPETERVICISEYFKVTTDYLLKDGPEQFLPVPRRLPDLEGWYREKGYQLGWLAVAAGAFYTLRLSWSCVMMFGAAWRLGGWFFGYYVMPWLLVIACGLLGAIRGRRYGGQLRWYHAGWAGVMAGVSGFLWMAVVWLIDNLSDMVEEAEGVVITRDQPASGSLNDWLVPTVFFAVLLLAGSVMLWVGKRREER